MLPFARMIQYGNVVQVKDIVDIQVSRTHALVLDSDGNLWGRGTNTNNILNHTGMSNTSTFVLVDTGVTAMFCGYILTLYVKNGVLYRIGSSMTWDAGAVLVPTAVSIPFSAASIKKIQCVTSTSIMILLNDGTMWYKGAGTNGRFGNGSTASVSTWTLSTVTDIKDIYHCVCFLEGSTAFSILLKNDGTVWGAGSVALNATLNTFRFGTYLSTSTWFQRTVQNDIVQIAAGSGSSVLFLDSTGVLRGDGNTNGELSGNTTSGTYNNTLMANGVKLFGLNWESSYYVHTATPTVLNAGGRNFSLSSSFTSSGTYVGRTSTDLSEEIKAIYTTRGVDSSVGITYISLQGNNVVMGGNSTAYQLGVNTGNINLVQSNLPGVS